MKFVKQNIHFVLQNMQQTNIMLSLLSLQICYRYHKSVMKNQIIIFFLYSYLSNIGASLALRLMFLLSIIWVKDMS